MADLRVVPRLLVFGYAGVCYMTLRWFFGLDEPTTQQVTAFTTVFGAAPAWLGLYVNSGSKQ